MEAFLSSLPRPNIQAISWFYSEYKKGVLVLNPRYQRKPVWSRGQQCFLIDSILSDCPIPQVFINVMSKGSGTNRRTTYEVVDGQQRLNAIFEYLEDSWELKRVSSKGYPFSSAYKNYVGKKYSQLPDSIQNSIWNYQLSVQELREWTDAEIQALFRRLNLVNVRLSRQELRHSQYFGLFANTVDELVENPVWEDFGSFTRGDVRRMKDAEFVAELLILIIDGIQDQPSIDGYYSKFDFEFPERTRAIKEFNAVLKCLGEIRDMIGTSRFHQKADFYGLFAMVHHVYRNSGLPDLRRQRSRLRAFALAVDTPQKRKGDALAYYNTVIEGANKLKKRQSRVEILLRVLGY